MTPEGPGTHLLVDEPQWVLDVWALEGNGRGGTLKHLHEQVVEEPDWGEDHMAQLKRQGQTHKVSRGIGRGLPPALPSDTPVGSHLQASALAVPCWECPRLTILIQGTQHAFGAREKL